MRIKNQSFVALFLGILLLTSCGSPGPAITVKKFFGYLQAGRAEKALTLVSTTFIDTYGTSKVMQILQGGVQDIKSKGGIRSLKISSETIDGDSAAVVTLATYGNGEESSDTSSLVKENGSWKLAPTK